MVLFAAGQLVGLPPLTWTGALLMATGVLLHLYLVRGYFRTRTRRRLDPGLAHMAAAFCWLALATACGLTLLASPGGFNPREWAAYGLAGLLGWLVLMIVGVYHRILPFLTWLHLFGPRVGEPDLPTVADLTRPGWGWVSLCCLVSGLALLVPSVALGAGTAARVGALAFACGVGLVLAQAVRVLALRRRA
jgi:hypothetical protein